MIVLPDEGGIEIRFDDGSTVTLNREQSNELLQDIENTVGVDCPDCGGRGITGDLDCKPCGGLGWVQ